MFHVCQQSRHNKTHHHNGNVDVLNSTSEAYYETPPDHRYHRTLVMCFKAFSSALSVKTAFSDAQAGEVPSSHFVRRICSGVRGG